VIDHCRSCRKGDCRGGFCTTSGSPACRSASSRVWDLHCRVMFAAVRMVFSASKVAILVVRVVLLACKFLTVCCRSFSWPASCWSWVSRAGLAISSSSSKQVCCVETMVDGVRLTRKSQSTDLLGDTLGDRGQVC
jgi:hypothetical protein